MTEKKDKFAGFEEVQKLNVTFNKVDDYIKGTYLEKIKGTQPDQYGKISDSYSIKVDEGTLHDALGANVIIEAGQIWRLYGGKTVIDSGLSQAKVGQKIVVQMIELRPTKKGNPAKIMKVLHGGMDPEFKAEDESEEVAF